MATSETFFGSRARVALRSELDELSADLKGLQKVALPTAEAIAVGKTLECTRDKLQKRFNKAVDGGPANNFIGKNTFAWNVGRFGKFSTGTRQNAVNVKEYERTRSGRVFVQDTQEKILDPALSGGTVTERTNVSGRGKNPEIEKYGYIITIPKQLKQAFLRGDKEGKKLILKYNRKGNIVRFKQGAFKQLRAAAKKKVRGNRPHRWGTGPWSKYIKTQDAAKYFEVLRRTTNNAGKQLWPGIYRVESNKKRGDRLKTNLTQVVSYRDKVQYKKLHRKFNFDQIANAEVRKEFPKKFGKALDEAMKELGFV